MYVEIFLDATGTKQYVRACLLYSCCRENVSLRHCRYTTNVYPTTTHERTSSSVISYSCLAGQLRVAHLNIARATRTTNHCCCGKSTREQISYHMAKKAACHDTLSPSTSSKPPIEQILKPSEKIQGLPTTRQRASTSGLLIQRSQKSPSHIHMVNYKDKRSTVYLRIPRVRSCLRQKQRVNAVC